MHEVSIIENVIDIAFKKAEENHLRKLSKISLKIGELSGVMDESLIFAFNSIRKGTIADNAELEIQKVKAKAFCETCDSEFAIDHFNKQCPHCNKFCTKITSGYELYIDTIEGD